MKFFPLFILFSLFINTTLFAQQSNELQNNVLRGKILFLNSKKSAAKGVEISGTIREQDTANTDFTNGNGEYELEFAYKSDGQYVQLEVGEIDQNGQLIEVVNEIELQSKLVPADGSRSFEIIVCKKGHREEIALKYYKIFRTSNKKALEKYKKEIRELIEDSEFNTGEISRLTKKISQLQQQNDSITIYKKAYKIASINIDTATDRVKKYLQLLNEGKSIEEAIEALDIDLALKEAKEGISKFNAAIQELVRLAEDYVSLFHYNKAISAYSKIIVLFKDVGRDPLEMSRYLVKLSSVYSANGQNQKALELNFKALQSKVASLGENAPELASNYNWIASDFLGFRENIKAIEYGSKALSLLNKMESPDKGELSAAYNNLALGHRGLKDYSASIEYFDKALEIMEVISEPRELAILYDNMGGSYIMMEQLDLGLEYYEKAFKIFQPKLNDKQGQLTLAKIYNNAAGSLRNQKEYKAAIDNFTKAINIEKGILPRMHIHLGIGYANISDSYFKLKEYEFASKYQLIAIDIFENTNTKHPDLELLYYNQSVIYNWLKKPIKSEEYLQKSLTYKN